MRLKFLCLKYEYLKLYQDINDLEYKIDNFKYFGHENVLNLETYLYLIKDRIMTLEKKLADYQLEKILKDIF